MEKVDATNEVTEPSQESDAQVEESSEVEEEEEEEYVGRVRTNAIHIKSIIMDKLRPEEKKYDLIIVQNQLLLKEEFFPNQVDENIEKFVKRLAPNGRLVLIERGNPLGSESIARARQVILRPETYGNKVSKIPRPYKSSIVEIKEKEAENFYEKNKLEPLEDDGEIEKELLEAYDIVDPKEAETEYEHETINLKVLAPCAHHGGCPLQFRKLEYYNFGQIGKKLKFCNFTLKVERPKFLMELKRGARLATKWTDENSGIGKKGMAKAGTGRPGGLDFETVNYSYLIVERSDVDPEKLEKLREQEAEVRPIGFRSDVLDEYPRVLAPPLKKKGFVVADMCGPSGHIEKWVISKSVGKQEYHDARKLD
ncbi:unnamed protein product [Ambrosiozyma monospora]|uniref:Unnamed protein product n=1 Tax=Ambrosiozyma monospora TaxID=43982 RepID=A0ACB5TZA5_AMBMO|nr:unnamed protein product [Ambrosiozyma monospora]